MTAVAAAVVIIILGAAGIGMVRWVEGQIAASEARMDAAFRALQVRSDRVSRELGATIGGIDRRLSEMEAAQNNRQEGIAIVQRNDSEVIMTNAQGDRVVIALGRPFPTNSYVYASAGQFTGRVQQGQTLTEDVIGVPCTITLASILEDSATFYYNCR